jgi:integrase
MTTSFSVIDWATVHQFRAGPNPAAWKGNLEHVFGAKRKNGEHHKAMPYEQVPGFMAQLRDKQSLSAKALEVLILTAARPSEVLGMTWGEIDFAKKLWTIPAARMKAGVEHTVPLSDRALAVLQSVPRNGSDHVFPLSNMAMLELLKGMNADCTAHGFRSSYRDWSCDKTSFDREVIEHSLAHQLPNKTEAAYRRGTALNKRRLLMEAWSDFCSGAAEFANVVKLHG